MAFFTYHNKKIYYSECGNGPPLLIIHGNSVSSRMHSPIVKKLSENFRVISPDLPGHGRSEKLESWPVDFWFESSRALYNLILQLELQKVIVSGYSGGALIALNLALEHPDAISCVIADSFEGEVSIEAYVENLENERRTARRNILNRFFWFLMHGKNWNNVITNDTAVTLEHHRKLRRFFHKDLSQLSIPVLFTGSAEDEYLPDLKNIYLGLKEKIPLCDVKMFRNCQHPSMLTAGMDYLAYISNYLELKSLVS